jgi:hypothetical protein
MGITYKIEDVGKVATPSGLVELSNAEKQAIVDKWNAYQNKSNERKLEQIKNIRLEKLIETDYLAMSDNVMSDEMKNFRKSMRDIPQNNTTEEQYDLILARDEQGNLTHAIWSKP